MNTNEMTNAQIQNLIVDLSTELARRAEAMVTAPTAVATAARETITVASYGNYNARRYGKPWVGRVTGWTIGKRPEIEWGSYLGRHDVKGENGGDIVIAAAQGDIVRWGQKDYRGSDESRWGIVDSALEVTECTESEAFAAWQAR